MKIVSFALIAGLAAGLAVACHVDQLWRAASSGGGDSTGGGGGGAGSGPAPREKLVFSTQPTDIVAGSSISPAVQVTVMSVSSGSLTSYDSAITLALGANPSGAALAEPQRVIPVNGIATFTDVRLNKAGDGYTLTAAAPGAAGATSERFTVAAGVPKMLSFTIQPKDAAAGAMLGPFEITAFDAWGNVVTPLDRAVRVEIGRNAGTRAHGRLNGTTSRQPTRGVTRFADLSIDQWGSGYTLRASIADGEVTAESERFNITALPPSRLAFAAQPPTAGAGKIIAPPVAVAGVDNMGATASGYTGSVTIALGANPGNGALSGTLTVDAVDGVATFRDLSVSKAAAGYTLSASASGLDPATSQPFTVNAVATQLVFVTQPHDADRNHTLAPPIQVAALDADGNLVTTYAGTVTMAIGANPGHASLSGTRSVKAVNGVATFSTLKLNKRGNNYTLVASATGLKSATSAPFDIND